MTNIYINEIDIDEMEKSNLTFIDLGECGKKIKKYYNLDSDEQLYILSIENTNTSSYSLTNQIEYQIFLKNGTQLTDLSACNDEYIIVDSPISNLDLINLDEAENFYSQGYDIFNLSSEFYSDICKGANINENDITLKDRKEEIYPSNISFCSNGCKLDKIKIEKKRISCSCNASLNGESVNLNDNKLNATNDFSTYLLDSLNYKIIKCYKIIFESNIKDLVKNIDFLFGVGINLFNIFAFFIFSCGYLPKIRIQIFKIIYNKIYIIKKMKKRTIKKMY